MNLLTIIIGIIVTGYGVFSGVMRIKKPELFRKLEPMKNKWGNKAGNGLHFFGYVIVPVVIGIIFIISGFFGNNIFEVFN